MCFKVTLNVSTIKTIHNIFMFLGFLSKVWISVELQELVGGYCFSCINTITGTPIVNETILEVQANGVVH